MAGRRDAGRRTLFFPLRRPDEEEQIDKDAWKKDSEENRDVYLIETLARLQLCVQALGKAGDKWHSKWHRRISEMPEFETWTMRIAGEEGWGEEMADIWAGYMKDYRGGVADNSQLAAAVRVWIGSGED